MRLIDTVDAREWLVIFDGYLTQSVRTISDAATAHTMKLLAQEHSVAIVATMGISGIDVRKARASASRTADLLDALGELAHIADTIIVLDRCIDDSEAGLEGAPFKGTVVASIVKNRSG